MKIFKPATIALICILSISYNSFAQPPKIEENDKFYTFKFKEKIKTESDLDEYFFEGSIQLPKSNSKIAKPIIDSLTLGILNACFEENYPKLIDVNAIVSAKVKNNVENMWYNIVGGYFLWGRFDDWNNDFIQYHYVINDDTGRTTCGWFMGGLYYINFDAKTGKRIFLKDILNVSSTNYKKLQELLFTNLRTQFREDLLLSDVISIISDIDINTIKITNDFVITSSGIDFHVSHGENGGSIPWWLYSDLSTLSLVPYSELIKHNLLNKNSSVYKYGLAQNTTY